MDGNTEPVEKLNVPVQETAVEVSSSELREPVSPHGARGCAADKDVSLSPKSANQAATVANSEAPAPENVSGGKLSTQPVVMQPSDDPGKSTVGPGHIDPNGFGDGNIRWQSQDGHEVLSRAQDADHAQNAKFPRDAEARGVSAHLGINILHWHPSFTEPGLIPNFTACSKV